MSAVLSGPGVASPRDTLLLMGHGTQDPEGVEELQRLAQAVQAAAPAYTVEIGVLEFPGPGLLSIAEVIDRKAAAGLHQLTALPLLLHQAGHSKHDMPAELLEATGRHAELRVRSCPSLGIHPLVLEIVDERARAAAQGLAPIDAAATALLLVGRGSSDSEANADFYKVGRLIWERGGFGLVECCFVSLASPRVPEGIERCVRLGARRVLVIPYFLSTGVLVKRIGEQARATGAQHPGVEIVVGEHLGIHPNLIQVILERVRSLSGVGASDAAADATRRRSLPTGDADGQLVPAGGADVTVLSPQSDPQTDRVGVKA